MLSPAQQSALMPERLHGVPAANLFVALDCSDSLDVAALETALTGVLADNEILRSVFPADKRVPYQQVVPVPDKVLETVRLPPAELDAQLAADASANFDLTSEIPLRVRCYELPPRYVLSIAVHPVAADDRGLDLLVRALVDGYEGRSGRDGAQYRDFVKDQLKALTATPSTNADLAYWAEQLTDLPRVPRVWLGSGGAAMTRREIDIDAVSLTALRAAHPAADSAAVIAALASAMVVTAQPGDDIAVGLVDAARTGAESVIGNFANHLVLRLPAPHGRTARDVIGAAARTVETARAHRSTRVEQLAHLLRGPGAFSTDPLFGMLVRVRDEQPIEGPWVELHRRTAHPAAVDVVVDVTVTDHSARIVIEFPAALAGMPGIEDFVAGFAARCREWAADLDAPVAAPDTGILVPAMEIEEGLRGCGGPPVTETEQALAAAIWQVLDLDGDPIGREDSFFALGGDSILALKVVTLLGEQGYTVDVRTIFGHPVLHELAAEIDNTVTGPESPASADADEYAPMSASGLDDDALRALSGRFA
jgi:hypothetical protein